MGYTHYINADRSFTRGEWSGIVQDVPKVFAYCEQHNIPLKWEYDSKRGPIVNGDTIRFNGVGEDGHETFYYQRKMKGFWFCKTARKPYDLAVCVVLLMLSQAAGFIHLSSDGGLEDGWDEAIKAYKEIFGHMPPMMPEFLMETSEIGR